MKNTIAVVGLACKDEVGFELAPQLYRQVTDSLIEKGADVVDTGVVMWNPQTAKAAADALQQAQFDALVICVATWSEDNHLLELLPVAGKAGAKIILHAFPSVDSGSLCCVHQITSVFTDVNYTNFSFVYGEGGTLSHEIIAQAAEGGRGRKAFPSFNIGAVGGRVPGMTEIAFDEFALYEKCGAVIIPISETELLDAVAAVSPQAVEQELEKLLKRGFQITSSADALKESLAYYLAMKVLVERYRLRGLAVKCYTRYMGKVCLGYSLLSDEDIVCSCEGDVTNTVMMRILKDLTGQCLNHTDLLHPDVESNTILFAHCGSCGFTIAPKPEEVELAPVRLMERGVCSKFIPKTGKVTLADLVGHGDRLRMSVIVGEAVDTAMDFPGNPARVKFDIPVLELCRRIAQMGCGHHWMIGYGDVSKELEEYCCERGILFQKVDA